MLLSMFQGPSARKTFVVACKECRRDVPTSVGEFPFQSIVVELRMGLRPTHRDENRFEAGSFYD